MKKGRLICFEGPDGSGKDLQLKYFENYLKKQGKRFVNLREPGTTELGIKCREYLLYKEKINLNPFQEAALFNSARTALIFDEIIPSLKKGKIVLLNRYFYSTLAYQIESHLIASKKFISYKSPISKEEGEIIKKLTLGIVKDCKPDLTYIINAPIRILTQRMGIKKDKIESRGLEFLTGVVEAYNKIVREFPECVLIDGAKKPEEVHENIIENYLKIVDS